MRLRFAKPVIRKGFIMPYRVIPLPGGKRARQDLGAPSRPRFPASHIESALISEYEVAMYMHTQGWTRHNAPMTDISTAQCEWRPTIILRGDVCMCAPATPWSSMVVRASHE